LSDTTLTESGQKLSLSSLLTNTESRPLTWKSSNKDVATVNGAGTVTAVANGTAVITVKSSDDGGKYSDAVSITVEIPEPPSEETEESSGEDTGNSSGGNTENASGGNTENASGGNTENASGGNTENSSGGNTENSSGESTENASGGSTDDNSSGGSTEASRARKRVRVRR